MNALLAWSAPDARTDAVVDDLLYHGALHRRNFAGFAFAQAPEPAQEPDAFAVRHLRHHFGPLFAHFPARPHPTHTVCYTLRGNHADRVLIGACNPML